VTIRLTDPAIEFSVGRPLPGRRWYHSIAIATPLALPLLRSISEETGWRLRVPEGFEELHTQASVEYWLVFETVPPLPPGTELKRVAELWAAPR
jgi:hypothetical protein